MSYPVIKHGEVIPRDTISTVRTRFETVTRAINREFWKLQNDSQHSLLVGSYGRGTAIDTSDIDILVVLPKSEYDRYDIVQGNGQSRLLQAVSSAIQTVYPRSDVRADGQVVKIAFNDGVKFEVLPAFKSVNYWDPSDSAYTYPDTNMGGNWKSTNPKAEQEAMKVKNNICNGLLFDTCKHIRRVRDDRFSTYHLSGIVIDSFVYAAMDDWHWTRDGETSSTSYGDYEKVLSDYLDQYSSPWNPLSLTAPGSNQILDTNSSIECLKKVISYIVD
ncbi:MAG: nucleotidyltransferase domain-containing protein [Sphaerochaetaceae bacterium]